MGGVGSMRVLDSGWRGCVGSVGLKGFDVGSVGPKNFGVRDVGSMGP